jgi:hypothetical protein
MSRFMPDNAKAMIQQLHKDQPELGAKDIALKVNTALGTHFTMSGVYYQLKYAGGKKPRMKVKSPMGGVLAEPQTPEELIKSIHSLADEFYGHHVRILKVIRLGLVAMVDKVRNVGKPEIEEENEN